jgi:hypothetical protein
MQGETNPKLEVNGGFFSPLKNLQMFVLSQIIYPILTAKRKRDFRVWAKKNPTNTDEVLLMKLYFLSSYLANI